MNIELIQRAKVLGKCLDNGVINFKELRAFLSTVEAFMPLPEKKQLKKEERIQYHLQQLDTKIPRARKPVKLQS